MLTPLSALPLVFRMTHSQSSIPRNAAHRQRRSPSICICNEKYQIPKPMGPGPRRRFTRAHLIPPITSSHVSLTTLQVPSIRTCAYSQRPCPGLDAAAFAFVGFCRRQYERCMGGPSGKGDAAESGSLRRAIPARQWIKAYCQATPMERKLPPTRVTAPLL
jgi:hypothetical protein